MVIRYIKKNLSSILKKKKKKKLPKFNLKQFETNSPTMFACSTSSLPLSPTHRNKKKKKKKPQSHARP